MKNKVAIVTAAGRGMGAACARELHLNGYHVALMSPSGSADQVARQLDGISLRGSVTRADDLERLVEMTIDRWGRIDAVVNNTGHPPSGELLELEDADWHAALDLVVLNVVRMVRLVTPVMEQNGGGAIVNISTFGAIEPSSDFPLSSSLRAALSGFTKLYAQRFAASGIRMNNVLPGFIDSYPESAQNVAKIPMKRYGAVRDVARTVVFLLSENAAYVTGESLRVDGGLTRSI